MIHYTICTLKSDVLTEEQGEIYCAILANEGFEGFEISENQIQAYINSELLNEEDTREMLLNLALIDSLDISFSPLKNENWNKTWEENFYKPILIGEEVLIKSSFHETDLKANYEIVIDPKMSFGTGHHETTSSVLSALVPYDLNNKSVIDIGSGTGILAFYCKMRGSNRIIATDFDPICIENGKENETLNNLSGIEWQLGDRSTLENLKETFDIVIANINRNILLQDMDQFAKLLNNDGTLFLSGFYSQDVLLIETKAKEYGLSIVKQHEKNNWVCLELRY